MNTTNDAISTTKAADTASVGQYVTLRMNKSWSIVHITLFFAEVQGGFKTEDAALKFAAKHDIKIEGSPYE
jgi:hypothetical protein